MRPVKVSGYSRSRKKLALSEGKAGLPVIREYTPTILFGFRKMYGACGDAE